MNKIESSGLLRSKPLDAKVALVLFVSARANKKPKCMSEILHYLDASNSQVNACLKKTMDNIFSNVDFRLNAEDIIDKILWKLNLSEEVRLASKYTAGKLKPFMEGKPPKTIAAVALINVSQLFVNNAQERKDWMNRIADAVGVTGQTLMNNAKKVQQYRRQVLPESLLN